MKITPDFAPPLSIVAPFFVVAAFFYTACTFSLFLLDPTIGYNDFAAAGWVHLFLLGFVMSVILGAAAQLIPVALEQGHRFVGVFIPILYIFTIGTLVLVSGFWFFSEVLHYGGALVGGALFLYLIDVFATLFAAKRTTLTTAAIRMAHIFLAGAVTVGIFATLYFVLGIEINFFAVFVSHIAFGVGGYMFLVVIGVAVILLPMFGLAHGFSQKPAEYSVWSLSLGVSLVFISSFSGFYSGVAFGFALIVLATFLFIYQVFLINKKRVRKEADVWYVSLAVSFVSLGLSVIFSIFASVFLGEKFIKVTAFLFGMGFLFFLITGHLYKIIPFLVWFERFSPLVGKQKVPMLHQMAPKKAAWYQLCFGIAGVFLSSLGLLTQNREIWFGGVSFLSIGSLFLLGAVFWMIRFKGAK